MPYKQNGTGLSFVPDNYTPSLVDIKLKCNDNDAFSMCRYIAKNEGILLGGSSGSVLWAASKLLKSGDIKQDSNIVCILPDGGIKYIDSIYKEVNLFSHLFFLQLKFYFFDSHHIHPSQLSVIYLHHMPYPDNYTPSLVDIKLKCNDNDAFSMCRYIAKNEGLYILFRHQVKYIRY
jgi:cysteine synthase